MDATMSTSGRVVVTDHAGQYGGMSERRMWTVGSISVRRYAAGGEWYVDEVGPDDSGDESWFESRTAADRYAEVRAEQLADEQEAEDAEEARDAVEALLKSNKAAEVLEALRAAGLID
jgi:hypothetical protein